VAGAVSLAGLDVLEVGCGRGGGASYVARYLKPKTMTGVDFSEMAIRLCRNRHKVEGLTFIEGDAENLPFPDSRFDTVINVESSHCYGSIERFLSEVKRVLKPGGYFLFADLRGRGELENLQRNIANSGMSVIGHWDITANVLEALALDNDRKLRLIHQTVRGPLLKYFKEFAGVKDAGVFERFQKGENTYLRYVLKKS
ncbi:class I SAM-dependent methyltransferase, partial [bacterium]|nr:class I SAM-dependent methyltransferase [bacterium]